MRLKLKVMEVMQMNCASSMFDTNALNILYFSTNALDILNVWHKCTRSYNLSDLRLNYWVSCFLLAQHIDITSTAHLSLTAVKYRNSAVRPPLPDPLSEYANDPTSRKLHMWCLLVHPNTDPMEKLNNQRSWFKFVTNLHLITKCQNIK